jgi:hypothetical protein
MENECRHWLINGVFAKMIRASGYFDTDFMANVTAHGR